MYSCLSDCSTSSSSCLLINLFQKESLKQRNKYNSNKFLATTIGEQCTTKTNMNGFCTYVNRCPSVSNDILEGKREHVVCGYEGFLQIICCPTTQPTSSRTTQSPISAERLSSISILYELTNSLYR